MYIGDSGSEYMYVYRGSYMYIHVGDAIWK